jgi:putative copper resistance protein D
MSLYHLNVTLHVLAAMLWLGGMFFLGAVGAPVLRKVEPPALRAQLFQQLGTAFRTAGWISIAVLLITGVLNLHFRGFLSTAVLGSAAFWQTRYGLSLAVKLVVVTLMLAISAVHDFVHGPAAARFRPGTAEALRHRRQAAWLARVNALLGVLLVFAAVRLARGG